MHNFGIIRETENNGGIVEGVIVLKTVIQISDFHIRADMDLPEHNLTFKGLVEKLRTLNHIENPILVYNGDLIDSYPIKVYIDREEAVAGRAYSQVEKESIWNREAAKSFSLAQKYLSYLINTLKIPNDHIIICCGNHDINLYASGSEKIPCTCHSRTYGKERFARYQDFLKNCLGLDQWVKLGTYFREIDGLNFLVVNSNWSDKESGKLCIDCTGIREQLKEHEDILRETATKRGCCMNLFVAHAPRTEYCEEALYPYKENTFSPVMPDIDKLFGLQLFGDKHTNNEHNFDYIVGAPLDSDQITCGIHQFDEEYNHYHETLRYAKGTWSLLRSEANVKEILSISRDMIKGQALKYLYDSKTVGDLEQRIINFENVRSGETWSALDTLFCSCAVIKKPQGPGSSKTISAAAGFIDTVTKILSESSERVSITCRGGVRQGKSVFLSALYLNLLHCFISGTFNFMPIYINIEEIMKQIASNSEDEAVNRNTAEYLAEVKRRVEKILKDGAALAERQNHEICCIIDGLNKYVFYPRAKIESMVDELVENAKNERYAHYIYCLDTESGLSLAHTPQHTKKNAEYLIYFDQIKTYKISSKEKYRNFVESFCKLRKHDAKTADIIMENIERMEILEIDMNVLVYFWEDLCVQENSESFFSLLDNFANKKINTLEMDKAAKASYSLYIGGRSYSDICRECGISNQTFEVIRTQKPIAKYLQAKYYVDCIQTIAEGRGSPADYEGVNQLYNHEICSYIRRYIIKVNVQAHIFEFAKTHYGELNNAGKATFSYLLGRISPLPRKVTKRDVQVILEEEAALLQATPDTQTELYEMHIAKRSVRLSKILIGKAPKSEISNYIKVLISDEFERKINRNFYLQFYGDRSREDIQMQTDTIFNGFDMYCTFHILANRLKKWREHGKDYPLLSLELFTLCDLLQVRLDTPIATVNDRSKQVPSFFYNATYNKPQDNMAYNIIQFAIEMCRAYIDSFENAEEENLFVMYLTVQHEDFCAVRDKLEGGALPKKNAYNPKSILQKLTGIETMVRTGWCIPHVSKKLSAEEIDAYRRNGICRETTLEHIFEMMLIGMLYLPEISEGHKEYSKQKILDVIWIHDLGEADVTDSVPSYEGYARDKEAEKKYCERLFLQGIHSGIADMTKYLELWDAWSNEEKADYNISIAKELDLIQRLYKLMQLLLQLEQAGESFFTIERVQEFWRSKSKIKTNEGKHIFNLLLASDASLIPIAKKYGLALTALK